MDFKDKIWFKVLDKEGNSIHGGNLKWSLPNGKPGEWHKVDDVIQCCVNGLHFTSNPIEWTRDNCRFFISELDFHEYDFQDKNEDDSKICVRRGRLLREATAEELYPYGIYLTGLHTLSNICAYVCGNAIVHASDSVTVRACGSVTVRAYDSVTVIASGDATVQAYDSVTVIASGNATVQAYDNAYILFYNDAGNHTISENAIKKDYFSKKIYMSKDSHVIVEV
jgi:hypothetical protein